MPSLIINNPLLSGAQVVVSGFPWSGKGYNIPQGGIQFVWTSSGGQCYLALSGGGPPLSGGFMTANSGGMALSGGCLSGMLDGIPIPPGGSYFIPRIGCGPSGSIQVFAICDQAASGVGRLAYEVY